MDTPEQMTRRDYFAAMAMQGIASNSTREIRLISSRDSIAGEAVRMADELIKALETIDEEE